MFGRKSKHTRRKLPRYNNFTASISSINIISHQGRERILLYIVAVYIRGLIIFGILSKILQCSPRVRSPSSDHRRPRSLDRYSKSVRIFKFRQMNSNSSEFSFSFDPDVKVKLLPKIRNQIHTRLRSRAFARPLPSCYMFYVQIYLQKRAFKSRDFSAWLR